MQRNEFLTENNDPRLPFVLSMRSLLSWRFLSVLSFIGCILVGVFQYISPTRAIALVSFILFPFALCMLALLIYNSRYIIYFEVKLMAALFVWMIVVSLLYGWHADGPLSSSWFQSVCITTFLCFSLPYAFNINDNKRIFTTFAVVLAMAVTLLCAVGLFFVMTGQNGSSPGKTEFFGIGTDGRLHLLCHPNSVAPICGSALILMGYLIIKVQRRIFRIVLSLGILVCFFVLALTDSRAGIFNTSIALGFEIFLLCNVKLFRRLSTSMRILLCAIIAVLGIFVIYQSANLARAGYNWFAEITSTEQVTVYDNVVSPELSSGDQNTTPTLPPIDMSDSASVEPVIRSVSSRDLSDFGTFNGRTAIWLGVLNGLAENPRYLAIGTSPLIAGNVMAPYFPENSPIGNFHNSFLSVLVSFGIPGLSLVLIFLIILAIVSARLAFTNLTNVETLGIRLAPAILLFSVSESMMENFLFTNALPNIVWIWFMYVAGFVFRITKNDNK